MEIYRKLKDALDMGEKALLATDYYQGGVKKELIRESDPRFLEEANLAAREGFYRKAGEASRLTEAFAPKPRLIIFGGGHIALPIARLAPSLGFSPIVYDDRPQYANKARFPEAGEVFCEPFTDIGKHVKIRGGDYVAIVTRGHVYDADCLKVCLSGVEPYYLGMIGSRRRVAVMRQQFLSDGYDPDRVGRLCSPIGLSIGAQTPEEIAISIFAQIIERRRKGPQSGEGAFEELCRVFPGDLDIVGLLSEMEGEEASLITVLSTVGSTPRKEGARMVSYYDGRGFGSVGGGCAEADAASDSRKAILSKSWLLRETDLTDEIDEDGMACGGKMQMMVEPIGL